jgi:hypothetical protein
MAAARNAENGGDFSINFDFSSDEENNECITRARATPSSTPSLNRHFNPTVVPNSSAAWATAAYLYHSLVRVDGAWKPGEYGNPRLLRWLLDWVQVRFGNGSEVASKSFTGELWLWRVVIGAYALTVAGSSGVVENLDEIHGSENEGQRERVNLAAWYSEQLYRRRQATWTPGWDAAKEVLEKIHWLQIPGSHGEHILEKLWQDSVRDSDTD